MTKILYLGNSLSKHGFTPTSVETLGERLKENYIVVQGSHIRFPLFRLLHMWSLMLRHRDSKLVIIDTYSSRGFWFAYTSGIIAWIIGMKYIPILRGGDLPVRAQSSPVLLKGYLTRASEVVCPSNYLFEKMLLFFSRNYRIIPNYIEIEKYPFELKQIRNKIRLLWVRSFHTVYNPQLAIRIVKILNDQGIDVKLCMIGPEKDGSLSLTQRYAAEMGVENLVSFPGRLSKAEWIEYSKGYNIFINTTNVDNTPVSVIEAMALGFPVISTNVGGVPYLVTDKLNGILVDNNSEQGFVNAIVSLMADPELTTALSISARQKAENLDWAIIKKEWEKLFDSILS